MNLGLYNSTEIIHAYREFPEMQLFHHCNIFVFSTKRHLEDLKNIFIEKPRHRSKRGKFWEFRAL